MIEKLVMDCIVAVESAAIVLIYMRSVVRGRRARRALGTPGAAPDPTGEPAKASISVEVELADADLWQLARDLVSGQKYVSANRLETVERLYRRKDPKEIADVDLWGPLVTVGDRIEELKSELDKWNRLIFLTDEIASKLRRASGKK